MIKNKINEKIYIGQTIRPIEKRLEEHQKGKDGCRAIYGAIKKYGWDNFEKDYYECPDEDLNFDEDLLVREMKTLSPNGYNLREGGGNHGKPSEESKQKNRESHLGENNHNFGKTRSKETKQKIGDGNRGKKHSDETKKKQREAKLGENNHNFGKPRSKETRQKQSESQLGANNYKSKRVYQYDLDGTFIDSFGSCGEADRHVKGDGTSISACARGARKSKTVYGFQWSYAFPFM
jgi:hypothetical protein